VSSPSLINMLCRWVVAALSSMTHSFPRGGGTRSLGYRQDIANCNAQKNIGACENNTADFGLYSEGAWFESWPTHRLPWLRCFVVFLGTYKQILRWCLRPDSYFVHILYSILFNIPSFESRSDVIRLTYIKEIAEVMRLFGIRDVLVSFSGRDIFLYELFSASLLCRGESLNQVTALCVVCDANYK
jgi:hypothetical protein